MLVGIFENVISVSVSLSIITAILLCFAPYIETKYSFKWWRYIWLVLALRLIFFFRVSVPIINKETTTIKVSSKPIAFIQKLETGAPLMDSNMHSVWQDVLNYLKNISVLEAIALIWVIVVFLRLFFCFTGYYIFRKKIKLLKSNVVPESINRILQKVKGEYHINKDIKIVFCNKIKSPMLTGFFSPIIIFPMIEYAEREMEFILRHELMHLKQHDIWYKFILFISESIHWFNPIIRIAFRKANNDLEIECDSKVVKNQGEQYKKTYSDSLLEIMNHNFMTKKFSQSSSFTTNYSGGKKVMKKRFKNILDLKSKKNGTALLIVSLLLIFISSGLVACASKEVKSEGALQAPMESITPTNNLPSEDISDKTGTGASQVTLENQSNNSQDHETSYYLNSTESVLFQETTWKFAKAYFSSDKEEIKKYLSDGVEPEVWEENVYDKLSRLILKWKPEELTTDKNKDVQYEFVLEGQDSCTYLGMVLEYQNDKWIVQEYYLEK